MGEDTLAAGTDLIDEAALLSLSTLADRLVAGQHAAPEGSPYRSRGGGSGDFLDHQPYAPGADPRFIDWRASARTGRLLVRRHLREAVGQWYVIVDASASMGFPGPAKWAMTRRLAAALLFLLLNRGNRAGLLTFGHGVSAHCPVGQGRAQLARVLSVLSAAMPASGGGASRLGACLPYLGSRHAAIVIGDFLTPDGMAGDLLALRGICSRMHVLQVVAPEEAISTRGTGNAIRDAETGSVLSLTATADAAETVRRNLAGHTAALRQTCLSLDIAFTACADTQDWRTHVVQHLRALRPGHT